MFGYEKFKKYIKKLETKILIPRCVGDRSEKLPSFIKGSIGDVVQVTVPILNSEKFVYTTGTDVSDCVSYTVRKGDVLCENAVYSILGEVSAALITSKDAIGMIGFKTLEMKVSKHHSVPYYPSLDYAE